MYEDTGKYGVFEMCLHVVSGIMGMAYISPTRSPSID